MSKMICVIDTITGNTDYEIETNHGYSLQYCNGEDSGKIHIVGQINNGQYDFRRWIKNWAYYDTVLKILKVHKECLEKFNYNRILFLEDREYETKNSLKTDWVFRIKVAPKDLSEIWGYEYIIESREYWVCKLSDENIAARIFSCLKRIDGQGGLKEFGIVDWEETYEEFGSSWMDNPNFQVKNILDNNFEWSSVRKAKRQISLMDYEEQKQRRFV